MLYSISSGRQSVAGQAGACGVFRALRDISSYLETYRSGHNGTDSKFCRVSGTREAGRPRKCWGFWSWVDRDLAEF